MKYYCVIFMIILISYNIWSSGSSANDKGSAHFEFGYFEIPEDEVSTIRISPTMEIIHIFENSGVDPKYLAMNKNFKDMEDKVRSDINKVINENTDDVLKKIKNELKSALITGDFDYSYMLIGNRMFTMSLYYK